MGEIFRRSGLIGGVTIYSENNYSARMLFKFNKERKKYKEIHRQIAVSVLQFGSRRRPPQPGNFVTSLFLFLSFPLVFLCFALSEVSQVERFSITQRNSILICVNSACS